MLLVGVTLGGFLTLKTMGPECPACDVKCPDAVSLSVTRHQMDELQKLKIRNGNFDQSVRINAENITIINCEGDTMGTYSMPRNIDIIEDDRKTFDSLSNSN